MRVSSSYLPANSAFRDNVYLDTSLVTHCSGQKTPTAAVSLVHSMLEKLLNSVFSQVKPCQESRLFCDVHQYSAHGINVTSL